MNVVVADRGIARFLPMFTSRLGSSAIQYCDPDDDAALAELLCDADVFVGSRFTTEMLNAAPRLRFVQVTGAGTDKLADEVWDSHVAVANVFEHEWSIAEYMLMAILALSQNLLGLDAAMRKDVWLNPLADAALPLRRDVRGQTLGLVGYGHIGKTVAHAARGVGMSVGAVRHGAWPAADGEGLVFRGRPNDIPELLRRSDFIGVVVPLRDDTVGLIGRTELDCMKPTAYLVNVARGPVVDEDALYDALRHGTIAGAALDVWYAPRPAPGRASAPSTLPFRDLPNVIMTPHISGTTENTFSSRAEFIADNVVRFSAGEPVANLVSEGG